MILCKACDFCRYYGEDYDRHSGVYIPDCAVESKWDGPEYGPCPDFKPRFVSDDLYEQLYNEDLAREYAEESE